MEQPLRVGVRWDGLAQRPDQLQRIAVAAGTEPVIWQGDAPAPDIDVLIGQDIPDCVPRDTPHLRLLQLESAGVDTVRDHPIWHSDVLLASATGVHGVQIPEHVMMFLLALRRGLPGFFAAQQRHEWADGAGTPGELRGLTLGLIGYGHIGRGIAHLARGFGMRVLATSPSVHERAPLTIPAVAPFADPPAIPDGAGAPDEEWPLARLHEFLDLCDAVVICAPLTPQTQGLLDAESLAHLKRGSYLVNIARGKIVEEAALMQALRDGRLAGAGLDVTDPEPLPADSPLWDLPNVIITPHLSGRSERYVERTVNIFLANLERLRRGERPLTAVDRGRGY